MNLFDKLKSLSRFRARAITFGGRVRNSTCDTSITYIGNGSNLKFALDILYSSHMI
jgi:hypothetical protein